MRRFVFATAAAAMLFTLAPAAANAASSSPAQVAKIAMHEAVQQPASCHLRIAFGQVHRSGYFNEVFHPCRTYRNVEYQSIVNVVRCYDGTTPCGDWAYYGHWVHRGYSSLRVWSHKLPMIYHVRFRAWRKRVFKRGSWHYYYHFGRTGCGWAACRWYRCHYSTPQP